MLRTIVAKKYDVQFVQAMSEDDFTDFLFEADQLDYDQLVILRTEGDEMIELDKPTMESMLEDDDVSKASKKVIKKLLQEADPDLDYMHIRFMSEGGDS